ncbi:MAG TPA: tetratricopeptide repeat protein [Terriglobales bacterium]|nr:tetratricopeptide repeat protein [Terriglobales bacterium]
MEGSEPGPENEPLAQQQVRNQLGRISASTTFRGAGRLRRFLEFIVGEALAGRKDQLKEYVVGVAVFDKPATFDPRIDPIVRVRARRLRAMLERYYREEGGTGELVIELPKGGYAPTFNTQSARTAPVSLPLVLANRNLVAVLAVQDFTPGHTLASFCQELRAEMVCALAQVSRLRVLTDESGESGGMAAHPGAALQVGGSVRLTSGATGGGRPGGATPESGIRILLHLADRASSCYVWADSLEGPSTQALELQQEAARRLAAKLASGLPGSAAGVHLAENLTARNLYLQGRYHMGQRTEEGLRRAAELFERALVEDPQFAPAHAGLADAYSLLGHYGVLSPAEVWTKAASSAANAVMLDANSAEAQASLAHVKASQDWDWAGAQRQFALALRLDPGYATARHWYAMSCLAPLGRLQEALEELRMAQAVDPVSAIIARDLAVVHYYRRDFDLALEQCDHTIELNPHFAPAYWTLGRIQEQRGDYEEAAAAFQNAIRLVRSSPRFHGALGHLYAVTKNRPACQKELEKLKEMAPERYVSPIEFAAIDFALGQRDAGFEWLDKACQDRCFELVYLNVDPTFDALRRDPRFQAVVRRLNLAEAASEAKPAASTSRVKRR